MAILDAQAPDGKTLSIDVPEGTPESAYPQIVEEAVQHYTSLPGALESGIRGAINNLPAGGQLGALGTSALKGTDYSQGMREFNQKAQEAKAEHPVAYGAGAMAGSVAPLAIPGVGEAMEAAPALMGAGLGAANAVGNTDLVQNPDQAIKQGLIGAGTGAALGSILPSGAKTAEGLEGFANAKTVQASGIAPGMLGLPEDELDALGSKIHELGLDKGDLATRTAQAQDLLQQAGAQIGDIGAGASPLTDPKPFTDQLYNHIEESNKIFGPEANAETPIYRQGVVNLQQPGHTFDSLQALKNSYGQRAFDSMGNVKNDAAANVYKQIKAAMESIVADSPTEYQDAMQHYSTMKDISYGLEKQLQQEQAHGTTSKGFGLAGKLTGMLSGGNPVVNVGAAAALAPTHPFLAFGALTPLATNPQTMGNIARGAAEAVPTAAGALKLTSNDAVTSKLLNMLNSNPQSLGKYATPLIQAAKTGGSQGLAVQHFLLSSQYPEYNSLMLEDKGEENANR